MSSSISSATTASDDLLIVVEDILSLLDSEEDKRLCQALRKRWEERQFQLAILGQFKRGKSTLLNALLGKTVSPVGIVPLTAIPTFIRRGSEEQIVVYFRNGSLERHSLSEIHLFVTEKENPENRRGVERVDVFVDSPFLMHGVCVIDTPGIGSVLRHNTAATLNILPHCDAALFVLSPDPPLTEVEEEFLRNVAEVIPVLMFVLTKADTVPPHELGQIKEYNQNVLKKILQVDNIRLYCVSAGRLLAQNGEAQSPDDGFEFRQLHADLLKFLVGERAGVLRRSIVNRLISLIHRQKNMIRLELEALALDAETRRKRLEQFLAESQRLRREQEIAIDILNADGARLIMTVNRAAAELYEVLSPKLRDELNKLVRAVTDREEIKRGLPSVKKAIADTIEWEFTRARAKLERQVRDRIQEIAQEHIERAAQVVEKLVKAAGDIFSVDLQHISPVAEFEFRTEDYWPVLPPPVLLGSVPLGLFARIIPTRWLKAYHARRIGIAVEESVRLNTEKLRFGLAQAIEASLRGLREEVQTQYDNLVARVHSTIESATHFNEQASAVREGRQKQLAQKLQVLEESFQRLVKVSEDEVGR